MAYCVVCLSVSLLLSLRCCGTHIFFPGLTFFMAGVCWPHSTGKRYVYAIGRHPVCVYVYVCCFSAVQGVPFQSQEKKDSGRDWIEKQSWSQEKENAREGKEGGETSLWSTLRDELIGVTRSAFRIFFWPFSFNVENSFEEWKRIRRFFLRQITCRDFSFFVYGQVLLQFRELIRI